MPEGPVAAGVEDDDEDEEEPAPGSESVVDIKMTDDMAAAGAVKTGVLRRGADTTAAAIEKAGALADARWPIESASKNAADAKPREAPRDMVRVTARTNIGSWSASDDEC
jgi:hypothetical protein